MVAHHLQALGLGPAVDPLETLLDEIERAVRAHGRAGDRPEPGLQLAGLAVAGRRGRRGLTGDVEHGELALADLLPAGLVLDGVLERIFAGPQVRAAANGVAECDAALGVD